MALSVPPGASLRVNFSASQGSLEKGPKLVSVSVLPSLVGAGQTVATTVKATNSTGSKLSGVWLTHLLPDGLAISGVTTDRGDALTVGSLVMANLGDMVPGDSATFTIIGVAPNDGGPQGNLPIVASLISREGVSAQARSSFVSRGAAWKADKTDKHAIIQSCSRVQNVREDKNGQAVVPYDVPGKRIGVFRM